MSRLPLEGIRIIDSTYVVAMPYAMGMATDLGAEVIKVEGPAHVDTTRGVGNNNGPDGVPGPDSWNRAVGFNQMNRGKRSLTLDLSQPEGRQVFAELVKVSDVVVENFTPRVMRRWELDYPHLKRIKPDIIMLSNTAYGYSDGPYSSYPGQATTMEAIHGTAWVTGYAGGQPDKAGRSYVDFLSCWSGLFAIASALRYRNRTGKGQWIDLAMYQLGCTFVGEYILDWTANGRMGERRGNRHPWRAPQGCYPCAGNDQWCVISIGDDQEWAALCQEMGCPELAQDPRYADALGRRKRHDELDRAIASWTRTLDRGLVVERLQAAGVPAGPVFSTRDVNLDTHVWARGYLEKVTSAPERGMGTRVLMGRPYKLTKTAVHVRGFAPALGEGNTHFLQEVLGLSRERVAELEGKDVVNTVPTLVRTGQLRTGRGPRLEGLVGAVIDPDYKKNLGI
ncbi:MAG: CoA transferase [Chloroflexi bacterium]|nr:CoA transferase [Chloroflexota bacterium]